MRPDDPTPSASPLDDLIAAYLQAVEADESPDRDALIAAHPEHAESLRAFFDDLDRVDRAAAPLRFDPIGDLTADHDGPPAIPSAIRYFGDYELQEEIAHGGMGVVYRATQSSLNRVVALKMILRGAFATPRDLARFRAEAESVAALDHPNIVPIYEVGEHEGLQYFSMKYIPGGNLAKAPRLDARAEAARLRDVALAVDYAHRRGILHRDLKPSNILTDEHGTPYVTDFGLAKRLTEPDRSFTDPGQLIGTPRYMAPEQAEGRRDLTVAADVYALGAILYERLSGRPPFLGDDLPALLDQVRHDPPAPLTASVDGTPIDRDLAVIARKCLEKSPPDRYEGADALAADLARFLRHEPITARPVGQAERLRRWCRRNPAIAGLTAAVAASLLIGLLATSYFAVRADARARAERIARNQAERAEQRAGAARSATEDLYARSLLRSLNPQPSDEHSLESPEAAALWELALLDDPGVHRRVMGSALATPDGTEQISGRAEPALIAYLGLNAQRRAEFIERLDRDIRNRELSLSRRIDLVLIALELGDLPNSLSAACVATFAELGKENNPDTPPRWRFWRERVQFEPVRFETTTSALICLELARKSDEESEKVGLLRSIQNKIYSKNLSVTSRTRAY